MSYGPVYCSVCLSSFAHFVSSEKRSWTDGPVWPAAGDRGAFDPGPRFGAAFLFCSLNCSRNSSRARCCWFFNRVLSLVFMPEAFRGSLSRQFCEAVVGGAEIGGRPLLGITLIKRTRVLTRGKNRSSLPSPGEVGKIKNNKIYAKMNDNRLPD